MQVRFSAARLIAGAFLALILLGTLLLKLPGMGRGEPLSWLDALFFSTSAATVTGYATAPPVEALTPLGLATLAGIVQLGGIGIMTAAAVALILVGRRFGLRQTLAAREELGSIDAPGSMLRLLGTVAVVTLVVEGAGALALFLRFITDGEGWARSIGWALFHAITGFCNAGFDIFRGGTAAYIGDPVVNVTLCVLIVAGGLGFPVLLELAGRRRGTSYSLHTKVVLVTSAALTVVGIVSFALVEWTRAATIGDEPIGTRLLASMFQGITPRTAGFATIDYGAAAEATQFIQSILMFIGTGPVSTGGGIRVTTLAIIVLVIVSQARGESDVTAFRRRLPVAVIRKALSIVAVAAALVAASMVALMLTDGFTVTRALFESTSAFGTVGLSMGPTGDMSTAGKLVLVAMMFIGRVGPITFLVAVGRRRRRHRYTFPEEEIALG